MPCGPCSPQRGDPPLSYQVLARKWRPTRFDEVAGQAHVTTALRNAIRSGRVPHALLLTGPRGVGKTTIARLLARALNCEKGPTPEPCGVCADCREIAAGSLDRRAGDRRGEPHQRRRRARDHRDGALRAVAGQVAHLRDRRGAHALGGGVQRAAEDARGAAAAEPLRLRDDEPGEDPVHGRLALPALRPAPARGRPRSRRACARSRRTRACALSDASAPRARARRRGLAARRADAPRPGDRGRRRRGRRRRGRADPRPDRSRSCCSRSAPPASTAIPRAALAGVRARGRGGHRREAPRRRRS